jgi:universal stress protein A
MSIKRIACCTDFSENAGIAFKAALEEAKNVKAKLWVLHVLPPSVNPMLTDTDWVLPEEPKESLILKLGERMQQEYGDRIGDEVAYELVVLDGHVSSEILTFLEEQPIDLVVLGSYGFTGMGLVVFGSVAKRVSHKAPCSVMIVRERSH